MALAPMDITAEVRGLVPDHPDALVTRPRPGRGGDHRRDHRLDRAGSRPTRRPAPEALKAIEAADWVVLGPGSWFTSVIPHLLVPALRQALVSTDARVVVVLNLADAGRGDPRVRPGRPPRGCSPSTPRTCGSHTVLADAAHRAPRSSPSSSTWSRRTAPGWSSTTSRRRRDSAPRPREAGRGVLPDRRDARSPDCGRS